MQQNPAMKYTLRNLFLTVTILAMMAATLRHSSPRSVLVMLICVIGLLAWAAVASYFELGSARRIYRAIAIAGFGYLSWYVATNTAIEAWINDAALAPFALMKALPNAELGQAARSMEFQYFQQKVQLLGALAFALTVGWLASS